MGNGDVQQHVVCRISTMKGWPGDFKNIENSKCSKSNWQVIVLSTHYLHFKHWIGQKFILKDVIGKLNFFG